MKKLLLFVVLLSLFSCKKQEETLPCFYYWKTIFKLSSTEKEFLRSKKIPKLYVRYFDVKLLDGKPMPVSPIYFKDKNVSPEVIPVVFIKNEVFLSKKTDVKDLAHKITVLMQQINSTSHLPNKEMQIDCDWTLESKESFMQFLVVLKKEYSKTISATIRLHQIKYLETTKVPPVDYGVLMFYNMGTLQANGSNSIYDKEIALQYLPSLSKYPLKMKLALPIFSWVIHSRNNQIVQLISKTSMESFKNNPTFESDGNGFRVSQNILFHGHFFKEGDRLHWEAISEEQLEEMRTLVAKYRENISSEIIYYDLDEFNIKKYPNAFF